jgi:hypothetical protein
VPPTNEEITIRSLGRAASPDEAERVDSAGIENYRKKFMKEIVAVGRKFLSGMPEAAGSWEYGPEDWEQRGHAVVTVALLMGSVMEGLSRRSGATGGSFSLTGIRTEWPNLVAVSGRLGFSVPAGTPADVYKDFLRMLGNRPVASALYSCDENFTVLPDARAQIVLQDAGLIKPAGSQWAITQRPIGITALKSVEEWYRKNVDEVLSDLDEVATAALQEPLALRSLLLFSVVSGICLQVPFSGPVKKQGGFGALVGRLLGGAKSSIPGLAAWADPWGTWEWILKSAD